VVDYILEKAHSSTPAGETQDFLKADVFRRWLRQNNGPIKTLFGGQGLQNLDAVAADLRRQSYNGVSAPGSPTATYANAVRKLPSGHGTSGVGGGILALIGEHLAEHASNMLGHGGIMSAAAGVAGIGGGLLMHSLRQAGIRTMNDLERLAMLHPPVARELLARVGQDGKIGPLAQRRIATAVQAVLGANASSNVQAQQ